MGKRSHVQNVLVVVGPCDAQFVRYYMEADVCVYIYIYIYVCMFVHIYIYTSVYPCIYIHARSKMEQGGVEQRQRSVGPRTATSNRKTETQKHRSTESFEHSNAESPGHGNPDTLKHRLRLEQRCQGLQAHRGLRLCPSSDFERKWLRESPSSDFECHLLF